MKTVAVSIQKKWIGLLLFSSILFIGCRVTFLPPYSAKLANQISTTATKIDKFYLTMLETTTQADSGRSYHKFVQDYIDIEVDLNSLVNKNMVRPLNEHSTRICQIALKKFIKYKEEHKHDNTLSNGIIMLDRKYMSDLFYIMQVAEKAKDFNDE